MNSKRQASSFYPHFSTEERPTIDYFVGLFNQVQYQETPVLTNFLNPREQEILRVIVGNDLLVDFFGGYPNAERQRAFLQNPLNYQESDYHIQILEVDYNQKFTQIEHRDLNGAIHHLGLKDDVFGDLVKNAVGQWYVIVKAENAADLALNLTRVGRTSVKVKEQAHIKNLAVDDDSHEQEILAASLRIDAILAAATKKSRGQIQQAIAAQEVKINWRVISDSNIMVKRGDILSLRHFGRLQLEEYLGETKRHKHRLQMKIWQTRGK